MGEAPGAADPREGADGVVPLAPECRLFVDVAESNSLTQKAGAVFVFRGVEEGVVAVSGRFRPPPSATVVFCLALDRSEEMGSPAR